MEKKENIVPVSFYSLSSRRITGEEFEFSSLAGKKVIIVNVASKCGFTYQYEDLEKLYRTRTDKNLIILGFPSNDFFWQERGSDAEIAEFCRTNYEVTFPMMSKVKVRGCKKHPVYKWLTRKKQNGQFSSRVKWNFQKYLISSEGKLVGVIPPGESPFTQKIIDFLNS